MKKVFSAKKFIEEEIKSGDLDYLVKVALGKAGGWITDCEGKTEEEMRAMRYCANPLWMVEVEE